MLQAVVIPTPDDALRAADWLRTHDAGRAHFIVAGLRGGSQEANSVALTEDEADESDLAQAPRIADLLGTPKELSESFSRALPRELSSRVCNDLEQAISLSLSSGAMYVTLDGEWCAGGLIKAGDHQRTANEGEGLLAFKRELRELTSQADDLGAELPGLEQHAQTSRAAVDEAESAVLSLNDAVGRAERELVGKELQSEAVGTGS
ncbi:MAG: hypothetical protein WKF84_20185 [Pyrinomonadaceae bacterium]